MLFSRRFLKFITLFLALNLSSLVYASSYFTRFLGSYTVTGRDTNTTPLKKRAKNITNLNLSSNNFENSYFQELFSDRAFPKMTRLDLSQKNLTSLDFTEARSITLFPNLETLIIYGYQIKESDLIEFFERHTPKLKTLRVNCKIFPQMKAFFEERGVIINPEPQTSKGGSEYRDFSSGAGAAY